VYLSGGESGGAPLQASPVSSDRVTEHFDDVRRQGGDLRVLEVAAVLFQFTETKQPL